MITPGADLKVYVATRPVDFRNYAKRRIMRSTRSHFRAFCIDINALMPVDQSFQTA
jgi:hypothetical protein